MELDWKGGPEAAQRWLKGLGRTDPKHTSERLAEALRLSQQIELTPRERMESLEALGPALGKALNEQRGKIAEAQFPLDGRTRGAAETADRIAIGAITGYQTILRQLHDAALTGQKTPAGLWQTLAHRIFVYSFIAAKNRSLLDRASPKQLWLRINRLYLLAKKQKQADKVIAFPGFPAYPEGTLEQIYKQTLLLSLVPLRGLSAPQVEELARSLGIWARDLEIKVCREGMDREVLPFQIDPMADHPPGPTNENCTRCGARKCVLMDMGRLSSHLMRLLAKTEEQHSDRLELTGGVSISVSTLETLRQFWRQWPKRSDQRDAEPDANVEAIFSLRGIRKALETSGLDMSGGTADPEETASPETPGMDFLLEDEPNLAPDEETEFGQALQRTPSGLSFSLDEFEEPPPGANPSPTPFAEDADLPGFAGVATSLREDTADADLLDPWKARDSLGERFFSTAVKDRSKSGFQLEIALPGTLKLRVGDLIGVREDNGEPPTACVVRWIKESEGCHLTFGVERIAENLKPAGLGIESEELTSRNLPAVVGRHPRSGKTLLLAPFIQDMRKRSLLLEFNGRELPVALAGPPVEHSTVFAAYEFGVRRRGDLKPDPSVPLFTLEILEGLNPEKG